MYITQLENRVDLISFVNICIIVFKAFFFFIKFNKSISCGGEFLVMKGKWYADHREWRALTAVVSLDIHVQD